MDRITQKTLFKNKTITILAAIILISFIIHASPALFLKPAPLYNLDSWLVLEQVSLINSGNDPSHIHNLNPPNGKNLNKPNFVVSWKPFAAQITALFTSEKDPIMIFNSIGILHPLLFSAFLILLFILSRNIFGTDISLGIVSLTAFTPSMLFNDIIFGSFDHHLFEVVFGTTFILSILGIITQKKNWKIYSILAISSIILGMANTPIFLVYLATGSLILIAWGAYSAKFKPILLFYGFILAILAYYIFVSFGFIDILATCTNLASLLISYTILNRELQPSIPMLIISPLVVIVSTLLLHKLFTPTQFDLKHFLVLIAFAPLFIGACMLIRVEMVIAPMFAIFISVAAHSLFRKYYWSAVSLITIIFIFASIFAVYNVVGVADTNNGLSESLQSLSHEEDGVVMSWMGDAGFWIMAISNKTPMEDPSSNPGGEQKITRMFHESNLTDLKSLLRESNVSYVIVASTECEKSVGYAYKKWCWRNNTVGKIIWDKENILIYDTTNPQ